MHWAIYSDFTTAGVPGHAIWANAQADVLEHLDGAKSDIEDALRSGGYDLPIPETSVSKGMVRRQCIIAGYHYLRVRGWEVTSANDIEFIEEYKRCIGWLDKVATGKIQPLPKDPVTDETLDAKPETTPLNSAVVSDTQRGWSDLYGV
jgi:phage gp36-like protein